MAVAKSVNAATYYAFDPAWNLNTPSSVRYQFDGSKYDGQYFYGDPHSPISCVNTVSSEALLIGPTGLSGLLLLVVGAMLLLLLGSLILTIMSPPVTLNPLDPVSVLLVAQNSPPSHEADGGCLGNVNQAQGRSAKIQYRAVSDQHLAFVFNAAYLDPPRLGRMYGALPSKAA
ncbi:hypothetical protein RQP46_005063 [Phenoliferia psychrophenolica]